MSLSQFSVAFPLEAVAPDALQATLQGDTDTMMVLVAPVVIRITAVVVAAWAAGGIVRRVINRIDDERAQQQLLFFGPKLVRVLVIIGGMEFVGLDVSGMAALLATVGVTGAVAFTPIGQNFVAGAMITIDDLYRVGDVVTVSGIFGRVRYKSVLRTEMELPDGTTAWVPNSQFQEQQVLNHSRLGGCRISVEVPLDGTPDRGAALHAMNDALDDLTWGSAGRRPFVVFERVGGEAMFFRAFAWIDDRTTEPYHRGLLLTALVDALEEAGLSVGQTTNLSMGASTPPTRPRTPLTSRSEG
jgi:small-conductance mechanosensitive channel